MKENAAFPISFVVILLICYFFGSDPKVGAVFKLAGVLILICSIFLYVETVKEQIISALKDTKKHDQDSNKS